MSPAIDFLHLRPHRGSQAAAFEELTRQLVLAEQLPNVREIEYRGPGADGGVEVLVRFNDGSSWGWQSKWFHSIGASQIKQLKDSFKSAISNFGPDDRGRLTKFIVALPLNISGSGTSGISDARKRWKTFISWAEKESTIVLSRWVEIQLWDETAFISRLQKHDGSYPGIRAYWFDQTVFTREWFKSQLDSAFAALDQRYHPEDHVDADAFRIFDVVLHRDSVRQDLHRDFSEASAIYPVAPNVGGDDIPPIESTTLTKLNGAANNFITLESTVDRPLPEAWPVQQWQDAWHALVFTHLQPTRQILTNTLKAAGHDWNSTRQRRLWDHLSLNSQSREAFGSPWHRYFDVEKTRAILFVGEAGTGKSHLLARAAEEAHVDGYPVLLFLGQDFINTTLKPLFSVDSN